MFGLDVCQENDIEKIVNLLIQMDESGRSLLLRDANTLLTRQMLEESKLEKKAV